MAATTTLLGLVTPTQGTLTGTWGDTVNYGISDYVDISVAGTLTLTNDGAVTLANTTGSSAGSNITSTLTGAGTVTAQFAIVRVTGTLTVAKVVTGPSYSKTYTVVNAATGGIVTFKASGQTGVSVAVGESAFVYFNGTDYVKVAGTAAVSSFSAGTTGLTPNTATTGAVTLAGTLAVANGGTGLTAGTSGGVLAYTAAGTLASSSALAASALVIGGGAGAAPSTTTTGTGVVTALGVNTGTAGAFVVNGGVLGTPSSGTVTNLTGTASININGTVGATTPAAGSFTTVTASGAIKSTANSTNQLWAAAASGESSALVRLSPTGASADQRDWGLATYVNANGDFALMVGASAGASPASGTQVITATKAGVVNMPGGLNSTVIGATTPAAGSFTTLSASGGTSLATSSGTVGVGGAAGAQTLTVSKTSLTNPITIGAVSDSNTYGQLSFNGVFTAAGVLGINGGADANLYLSAPTGGTVQQKINNVKISEVSSTGLAVTGTLSATGNVTLGTGAAYPVLLIKSSVAAGGAGGSDLYFGNTTLDYQGYISYNHAANTLSLATSGVVRAVASSTGLAVTGTLSATGDISTSGSRKYLKSTGFISNQVGDIADFGATDVGVYVVAGGLNFVATIGGVPATGMGLSATGLAVTGLLDISAATAGQIKFPATQNPSADANTLDDYKESTWTPVAAWATQGTGTQTVVAATCTKIGRQASIVLYIIATKGSASGAFTVTGLPYTPLASTACALRLDGTGAASKVVAANVTSVGPSIVFILEAQSTAASADLTAAEMATDTYIQLSCTFHV